MFGFETFVNHSRSAEWSKFPFSRLTISCFALAWATTLSTLMAAAVERSLAGPEALRLGFLALVTQAT
jgi:hypothetical protein